VEAIIFKLFRSLMECSTSRELSGQGSLKTEGVVDRPVKFMHAENWVGCSAEFIQWFPWRNG